MNTDQMKTDYAKGLNFAELATKYGVTSQVARKAIRGSRSILSPHEVEGIRGAYQPGVTLTSLADRFGVSHTTVRGLLKDLREEQKTPLSFEDIDNMEAEYLSGRECKDLALDYDVCVGSVWHHVKYAGNEIDNKDADELREDYKSGVSVTSLSSTYRISRAHVRRLIYGLRSPSNCGCLTIEEIERIKELYGQGLSRYRLAKDFGVTDSTIRKHLGLVSS